MVGSNLRRDPNADRAIRSELRAVDNVPLVLFILGSSMYSDLAPQVEKREDLTGSAADGDDAGHGS
jgi:hypothetical protein